MATKKPQQRKQPASPAPAVLPLSAAPDMVIAGRMLWFLVAVGFALFANTLGHGFVLDDIAVVEQNAFVQEGIAGIPKLFSTFYWEGYWESNAGLYRPLSLVFFAIEHSLSSGPFIHHFMNVLLYALTIGLLFRLLRRLLEGYSVWIPFFVTLLFAVHPVHSEVVANIKSRDEILCFLFFILTFGFLLKNGLASIRNKLIAGVLFLLCLLSKETGILFLPVIGSWFVLVKKERILKVTLALMPLIVTAAAWFCLHYAVISTSPSERIAYTYHDNSLVACGGASQAATGIAILGRYLLKSVFPAHMSYDYSYNEIPCETFGSPAVIATIIVLIGMGYMIFRSLKNEPLVAFGLLFFLITILLATNIFTLIGTTMGDRLLFAPVLGICIAVVFTLYRLLKLTEVRPYGHSAFYGFSLIAVIAFGAAFKRNRDWESNTTLFTADVANAPNSARTHFNYGVVLMDQLPKEIDRQATYLPPVIAEFLRAIAIDPGDDGSHSNLGVCYYRLGDYKKSVFHSRKAMEINPLGAKLYNNLADAYFKNNELDSAVVYYEKTLATGEATASTYNFFGVTWFNKKAYPEAISVFEQGLKLFPGDEEMLMNLGSAYGISENYSKALETFNKVIAVNPNNRKAHYFLAMTYQSLGDVANTEKHLLLSK